VTRDTAQNPLNERYASKEMSYLFSADYKFRTWRKLWIALAEAEKELGLPISDGQIAELRQHATNINYADAERREREIRRDVMSHIYAYGLQAQSAKGIIHLGATSAFVTDNTDILQMNEALGIIRRRIVNLMAKLRDFAWKCHFFTASLSGLIGPCRQIRPCGPAARSSRCEPRAPRRPPAWPH